MRLPTKRRFWLLILTLPPLLLQLYATLWGGSSPPNSVKPAAGEAGRRYCGGAENDGGVGGPESPTEQLLLNATRDCAAFKRSRGYPSAPPSPEELGFPLAYSVVAHHRLDMLERLLRAVYAPQNLYCIHVDAKAPRAYLEAARGLAACFPNVFVAARLESVVYASWSRVQADLNCMRELLEWDRPGEVPATGRAVGRGTNQILGQRQDQFPVQVLDKPPSRDTDRATERGLGLFPSQAPGQTAGRPADRLPNQAQPESPLRPANPSRVATTVGPAPVPWKYFVNLCGLDFPLKTQLEVARALRSLRGANSLESARPGAFKSRRWATRHAVLRGRVFDLHLRKSPAPVPVFAGSAYMVATRAFAEHVLSDPAARAVMEWSRDAYSPDEHVWATLQRMPGVPGGTPPGREFDVTDRQALARLVRWRSLEGDVQLGAAYPPCRGVHVRGICIIGVGDVPWVVTQRQLFVNKVDSAVDAGAVCLLERWLRQRALRQAGIDAARTSTAKDEDPPYSL